jgi:hypothetical protein
MSPCCDYHRRFSKSSFIFGPGINFVKISAKLDRVSSFATLIVPAAIASRTLWKLIAACFFFRVDSGREFVTTAELSQKTAHSSGMGTPIIRNLDRNRSIISIAIRIASNSDPYVEASTVFCLFENHKIGARLTKMMIPECDLRVSLHPA